MLALQNFPKRATEVFEDIKLINYQAALALAAELKRNDKEMEMKKVQDMTGLFRAQYERSRELARRGE